MTKVISEILYRALELLCLESVGPHSVLCGSTGRSELRRAGDGRGDSTLHTAYSRRHTSVLINDDIVTRGCFNTLLVCYINKACKDIVYIVCASHINLLTKYSYYLKSL